MTNHKYVKYGMFDELRRNMQATKDEIDYIKQLYHIRYIQRFSTAINENPRLPSMIINDFLYHGNIEHASNPQLLEQFDIRHIISVSDIPLENDMFKIYNILRINVEDICDANIRQYFDQTNEFLRECKNKNERVLVHCQAGISRSSSIVLAYLLKYQCDSIREAYLYLITRRRIATPNPGFFLQLIRYENDLRNEKNLSSTEA